MTELFRIPRSLAAFFALATLMGVSTPNTVHAQINNPFRCNPPAAREFTNFARFWPLEAEKKLARYEFGNLPILPSQSSLLQKGTELNVVVDQACLLEPSHELPRMPWLRELQASLPRGIKPTTRSYRYTLDQNWDFFVLQEEFEREACVRIVSPEGFFTPFVRWNDPRAREQTHLTRISYDAGIEPFVLPILARPSVVIAIIDTGVDFSHEDLRLNQWMNPEEVAGNGRDDDRNGFVDDVSGYNFASNNNNTGPEGTWAENRHGTHVAGLAAGRIDNRVGIVGIAGVADIMSINVFGKDGFSRSSILENAIRYAADQGADVINMSLGGREFSRTMRSALSYAISKGSFIVTAAGNEGVELCDDPTSFDFISPAVYGRSLSGMVTIGSVDSSSGRFSTFSNFSPRLVEMTAPGAFTSQGQLIGLVSTVPGNDYVAMAGTSMSAPVFSGAAALAVTWLKAHRYSVSASRIEEIMIASSQKDAALEGAVLDGRTFNLKSLADYLRANFPPRR